MRKRDKWICLMIIKLSLAAPAAAASSVEVQEVNPPEDKIVVFDPKRSYPENAVRGLVRRFGSEMESPTLRSRLERRLGEWLEGGFSMTAARTSVSQSSEGSAQSHSNIIESGLSRGSSEFFPEAA